MSLVERINHRFSIEFYNDGVGWFAGILMKNTDGTEEKTYTKTHETWLEALMEAKSRLLRSGIPICEDKK